MRSTLLLLIALVSACATTVPARDEVVAFQSAPMSFIRDGAAAATTGRSVPAFQFTCTTTATRISPPSGSADYREITVWNAACAAGTCTESDVPVFLGGVYDLSGGRITAVTNTTGMPVCNTSGCIGKFATYTVPNLECIASESVDVTVQVLK